MKKILSKSLVGIALIIITFVAFNFGFHYGYEQVPMPPKELPSDVDISLLWDVWNKIEEKYSGDINYQEMIFGAAKGMVSGLGDPYTVFFQPEDSKIFQDDIAGSFEGVGMKIGIKKGELTVIAPLEESPAQKAGLLAGDIIIKVEDVYTKDITIDKAVKLIRGERGTEVNLTVYRDSWNDVREIKITRDVIKISTVKMEVVQGDIAHITIYQFSSNLDLDFAKITDRVVQDKSIKKIVLDLRNNPGGLLHQAQLIAGYFLEKGDLVTIESFGEGREEQEYLAMGNEILKDYPITILINQGTASGAEILAAALRDNRDGVKLIGEQSFGKGSVQEPINLRDGSLIKITIAHWLTPKGALISEIGLEPDIVVKMTEEDYKEERDPQLEKAIEILKAM